MSTPVSGIRGIFTGFTRLSKAISFILVVIFAITAAYPSTLNYVALIPGKTIPYAWNLLTAGYVESSPLLLISDILIFLVAGKSIEPVWGTKEFFRFILFVNAWTSICTFVLLFACYYATLNYQFLYTPISGFHGVVAASFVAIKQLVPEYEINILFLYKLRAKWISPLFVFFSLVLSFSIGNSPIYLPFIVFGTYCSWVYLRFFQKKSEANLRGDPSPEFAFATFFPEFIRPVVNVVATIFGKVFCIKSPSSALSTENDELLSSLPGSDPSDASRRRERGERALEERLRVSKPADNLPTESSSVLIIDNASSKDKGEESV